MAIMFIYYLPSGKHFGRILWEAIKPGTERNGTEPEVIDVQYGRGRWTRGKKLALIRTVSLSVRTLISRSVAATKTGQPPAESHVMRMNCRGRIEPAMGSVMAHVSLQVVNSGTGNRSHILYY